MSIDTMCPDPDRVVQLMVGDLPDPDVDAICDHVQMCEACTTILRNLSLDQTVQNSASLNSNSWVADPDDREAIEQLMARLLALSLHTQPNEGSISQPSSSARAGTDVDPIETEPESNRDQHDVARKLLRPSESQGELGWLGEYRVTGVLGAGGMGVVFEAVDPRLGRRVAVKAMQPSLIGREDHKLRFLREARAAASIDHDNIVPIHHIGEDRDVPFFVMPLLRGEALESRLLREGRLSVVETVVIGRQIAIGVAAAHHHGLVHRDIKPANIWLEDRGQPSPRIKILDFGLARSEDDEAHLTKSGAIAGTPAFMSPEQARGEHPDARSDLFSLGCVLYYMATGKPPFTGRNSTSVILAVLNHQPESPCDIDPQVPRKLDSLVMRLLQKDPALRCKNADEVAHAFQVIEEDLSHQNLVKDSDSNPKVDQPTSKSIAVQDSIAGLVSDGPELLRSDWARRLTRHGMIGGAVAVALIAIVLLFASTWILRVKTPHGTVILNVDSEDADGAEVTVDEKQAMTLKLRPGGEPTTLEVDPGTHTLKVAKPGFDLFTREFSLNAGRREQIKVRLEPIPASTGPNIGSKNTQTKSEELDASPSLPAQSEASRNTPFPGLVPRPAQVAGLRRWQIETHAPRGDIFAVAWDHDGRRIACGSPIGNVRILEVGNSDASCIIPAHTGSVWALDWSPTEDRIVTSGEDGAVRLFDSHGKLLHDLGWHAGTARCVAFSRDGAWIASGGRDQKVRLWRSTGEVGPVLSGHGSQIDGVAWHPSGTKLASASLDGTVRIWNLNGSWNRNQIQGPELKGHFGGVLGLSWSPDGDLLASAGVDGNVLLWTNNGTQHSVITGHGSVVTAIAWGSRDLIATSGDDKTVRLWRRDGTLLKTEKLNVGRINDLEWTRDGSRLAIAMDSQAIRLMNKTGELEDPILLNTTSVRALSFSRTGEIATGGDDRFLGVWSADGRLKTQLKGHTKTVYSVSWNPKGSQLVSGTWDGAVRVWDENGDTIAIREGSNPVAWNPTSDEIAWTSGSNLHLAVTGTVPTVLRGHQSQVIRLVWNKEGTQLASSDYNGEIRVWNREGTSSRAMQSEPLILALAWHPKKPLLACACAGNGNIQLWSADGRLIKTWTGHAKGIIALDWNPHDECLISSAYDQNVRVWNEEGNLLGTLPGPMAIGCAAAWNATGDRIATAHIDGTLGLWNGNSFEPESTSILFNDGHWARFDSKGLSSSSDPAEVDSRLVIMAEDEHGAFSLMSVSEFRKRQAQ